MQDTEQLLRIEEVAVILGVSINTINFWYRFKRENPDNEQAQLLPDYIQDDNKTSPRYWRQKDIEKFIQYQETMPRGRKGIMGTVTQKYVKHHKEEQ